MHTQLNLRRMFARIMVLQTKKISTYNPFLIYATKTEECLHIGLSFVLEEIKNLVSLES